MHSEKADLTAKAYQEIRQVIFSTDLKPGQKIPYRSMAKEMDMSLTPLIQALKHMEFMGLVKHEHKRGFVVKQATQSEILEAFRLRLMLEPDMLSISVNQIDGHGERTVKSALDEYLALSLSDDPKLRLVKDIQFHMAIARLSGQQISINYLKHLFDIIYLRSGQGLLLLRPYEDASQNHIEIFEAIRKRDRKLAVEKLKAHLNKVYSNTREGFNTTKKKKTHIVF